MAVPTIASTATQNANGFTDPTIVFSKPSGVVTGDLLLAAVCNRDGSACSPPSGWTTIDVTVYTGGSPNLLSAAYYRVADGSEGGTFTFGFTSSTDRSVGAIHRVTGADGTTPINAHGQSGQSGDSAADTSPSITTTVNDCLILTTHDHDGDPITNTVPAGTTALYYGNNNGVATAKGASTSLASAGATGTYQWTISGFAVDGVLRTLAIAPATGGGTTFLAPRPAPPRQAIRRASFY